MPAWALSTIGNSTITLPRKMVRIACHQFIPSSIMPEASMYVGTQADIEIHSTAMSRSRPSPLRPRHRRHVVAVVGRAGEVGSEVDDAVVGRWRMVSGHFLDVLSKMRKNSPWGFCASRRESFIVFCAGLARWGERWNWHIEVSPASRRPANIGRERSATAISSTGRGTISTTKCKASARIGWDNACWISELNAVPRTAWRSRLSRSIVEPEGNAVHVAARRRHERIRKSLRGQRRATRTGFAL